MLKVRNILLVGNPNVGKSTVFNHLCNKNQKTGNYSGVTVASYTGTYDYEGEIIEITDLPGAYSIYPSSEDEAIFSKYITQERDQYSGVIYVADALNMKRSLLLFQQIKDLGLPIIMLVNQIDLAERKGLSFNFAKMEELLGVKIIATNAKKRIGIDEVKKSIAQNDFRISEIQDFDIPIEHKSLVLKMKSQLGEKNPYKIWTLLAAERYLGKLDTIGEQLDRESIRCLVPKRFQIQETIRRYQNIDKILPVICDEKTQGKGLLTEKIDKFIVHPILGYIIFGVLLLLIFNCVYFLAEYPMGWIEDSFSWIGEFILSHMPEGPLRGLIVDGIIPGIAAVVVFAPQIGILLYFLYLLEDSGYMARVVFLMDRFLKPFGLNGKSVLPLVSSTACAIPAIMSTRNIENIKERLLTILVTPFMTCSARLPIYSIIISLVIPDKYFLGVFSYQALMLLAMYILGFMMSLLASLVLRNFINSKEKSYLILDLPDYKVPLFGYNFRLIIGKVWEFISGAGRVIFAISVILWVLAYFGPQKNNEEWIAQDVELEQSYLAIIGKKIEPIVEPLGYDWKMGIGVLTSFAAREAFVGTISTLYGLDVDVESEDGEATLIDKMKNDYKPNGEKVFSFATGMSILIFYAFAMQCISTIAIVYRETKSWRWTVLQLCGMSGLAYVSSFIVYQILR